MHWCADIWEAVQKFSYIRASEQSALSCYLIQISFCGEQNNKNTSLKFATPWWFIKYCLRSKYSTLHCDFKGCSFQTLCVLFPQEHPQWGVSENSIRCGVLVASKAISDPWFYTSSTLPTEIFCFLLIEILILLLFSTLIFSFASEWVPWGILIYQTACLIILF